MSTHKGSSDAHRISDIYSWASRLTSEERWLIYTSTCYVWPKSILQILHRLEHMRGGIIGLLGLQGVGKSSALSALYHTRVQKEGRRTLNAVEKENTINTTQELDIILFKWRRQQELFQTLLDGTHETSADFRYNYSLSLIEDLKRKYPQDPTVLSNISVHPYTLDIHWAESKLGKSEVNETRRITWLKILRDKKVILIDTPDYSKTDRRMMAKDLDDIYWIWHTLTQSETRAPTFVIAVQKEMFRGHYFFDKMIKIELQPLSPELMLEAYLKSLKKIYPFSKESILTLAQMSRGVFRRFLKYITITLDFWTNSKNQKIPINPDLVKQAITQDRLAEDMELELLELFPKHSDLRLYAVHLLLHLSESGPQSQSQLSEILDLEPYKLSRLLSKLELYKYINRKRKGIDKIVTLRDIK